MIDDGGPPTGAARPTRVAYLTPAQARPLPNLFAAPPALMPLPLVPARETGAHTAARARGVGEWWERGWTPPLDEGYITQGELCVRDSATPRPF